MEEATAREVLEETAVAVDVGELVCTMLWERRHDRRRNLLAYFLATPRDLPVPEPRGQSAEGIEAAAFIDPNAMPPDEIHPLHREILDRWWDGRASGFHLHAEVVVRPNGTQDYVFR